MLTVTRRIEFDAAHRLPGHPGKCRMVHGHRYVLEVVLSAVNGLGPDGMILDFGTVKRALGAWVDARLDHRLILAGDGDREDGIAESEQPLAKVARDLGGPDAVTACPTGSPTVENMAGWLGRSLGERIGADFPGVCLAGLRLFETPGCWADWSADVVAVPFVWTGEPMAAGAVSTFVLDSDGRLVPDHDRGSR